MYRVFVCFVVIFTSAFGSVYGKAFANDGKKTIRIAAIDWCPQLCPHDDEKGYIHDIVQQVFKGSDYNISIETMPWSRAIDLTRRGITHALLSPAKQEAPDLRYPTREVGTQRMCFFVKAESSWVYKGAASLKGMQIGIANDSSVEELNEYVQDHKDQFQFQPYGEYYIESNLLKLERKRIDAFIFTHNTTQYEIRKKNLQDFYKSAGCISTTPIFMAFSPVSSHTNFVTAAMKTFDKRIGFLQKNGTLSQILSRYRLDDWWDTPKP